MEPQFRFEIEFSSSKGIEALLILILRKLAMVKRSEQELSDVEQRTKDIYIEQHKNFTKDERIFQRFLTVALDPSTYDLPAEWFQGKTVLDAGCGNTGYIQVAMHRLGAKKITCLDLGEGWIPELKKVTDKFSIPSSAIEFVSGSTNELPFADNSFDFVISNGVVMHLETIALAEKAMAELTRVAAPGGSVYVYTGVDKAGIVDRYLVPALRQAYVEDDEFRTFVDNINTESVVQQLKECYATAQKFDSELPDVFGELIGALFTLDTATFTQNLLQVPVQQGPQLSQAWAVECMEKLGLKNVRRVKERYWQRNDFRRFLAPLHYRVDLPIPKMLYGNGHVKMIAEK
jgi:ubiquinone/menaquinone biosynthesis C-methylase UbiE